MISPINSRLNGQGLSAMYSPGEAEFISLAKQHNLVTVSRSVSADTETPVSAFIKLGGQRYGFLLESAEGGERWGRYSFIGCEPQTVIRYSDGRLDFPMGCEKAIDGVDPVDLLFSRMEDFKPADTGEELPYHGGAVGYFSYDLLPFMDRIELRSKPALGFPEMMFMLTSSSAAFDHLMGRIILMVNTVIPEGARDSGLKTLYRQSVNTIESIIRRLQNRIPPALTSDIYYLADDMDFDGVESNFTREEYEDVVAKAKEYIYDGEVYQVVPSQRFTVPLSCSPFSIYRCLRSENPSPYMFYLNFGDLTLIGSSPEPMVRQRGGKATIRPIAGTRPRGKTPEEDLALEEELKHDEKELAEHVMLVDLARNDLGRVCRPGTVKVTRMMEVERFSHVMHLVSEVDGVLRPGCGNRELLRSSFPAGTVSGAPKIRACQLIDEMEGDRRGPYAGAVGYISYSGDMDTCISIRTIVANAGKAHVQAGGGVVADSQPSMEYEETQNKARALLRAIRVAEAKEGPVI